MLLGFSFSAVIASRPNFNKEVTAARTQAEDAPDQADFMAQFNQLGANKTPQPIAWQQAVTAEESKAPAATVSNGLLNRNPVTQSKPFEPGSVTYKRPTSVCPEYPE
ncbi:MAG: hypothetical protein P8N61_06030 [Porticoccaceae bacterium]|nr:hypothetical protein [Porticoccaceae bacterium]